MALAAEHERALAFTAPFVVDRLVKDRVADSAAQAEVLFAEAKRYLVLCDATPDTSFGMHSAMVDAAWHTFVLFTTEYAHFGMQYFGRYLHHAPVVDGPDPAPTKVGSFEHFRQRYEELFAQPLPTVWYDDSSLAPARRVINDGAEVLTVRSDGHTVQLNDGNGNAVLMVNALASDAVDFIARTSDFYVRELPGGLTDDEKVGLLQPLVRAGVIRLAP